VKWSEVLVTRTFAGQPRPAQLRPGRERAFDVAFVTADCGLAPRSGGYLTASIDALPV
jgi:hypothetical protein